MNNLDELQQLMDEQQDSHERLLVGQEPDRDLIRRVDDALLRAVNKACKTNYGSWDEVGAYEKSREGPHHPIMKSYKSIDVFENVPGRGTIFMVNIHPEEQLPEHGEMILVDGTEYRLRYCEASMGLFGRHKCVGLVVSKPIFDPKKQDLPQGDTKTAAEEIDALKRRIQALEEDVRALKPNRLGPKPMGSAEFWSG